MAEIDKTGDLVTHRGMLGKVVQAAFSAAAPGESPEEAAKKLRSMRAAELGPVLDAVRTALLTKQGWY